MSEQTNPRWETLEVRTLTDREVSRLSSLYPDLSRSPDDCPTCGGRKSFLWYDENREPIEWACDCIGQWRLNRFFLHAGIGNAYQRLAWDDIEPNEAMSEAVDFVLEYLESAEHMVRSGLGMVLSGPPGTGKSMLALLALKHLLVLGHDGYFTTFSNLLSTMMAGWSSDDERRWFLRRIKNAGILVIDDIGREFRKQRHEKEDRDEDGKKTGGLVRDTTPVAESGIEEVVRHRLANALPTFVTTNLDIDELGVGYGGNLVSLVKEASAVHRIIGSDYRPKVNSRTFNEGRAGLMRPVVVG